MRHDYPPLMTRVVRLLLSVFRLGSLTTVRSECQDANMSILNADVFADTTQAGWVAPAIAAVQWQLRNAG